MTAIISFIFGFLWYGPLFGKTWAGLVGIKFTEECKNKKPPTSSLLLAFLGAFLTTVGVGYLLNISHPCCNYALAFMVWLGFFVPTMIGTVIWEGRSWNLFLLNGAYTLLNLLLITTILTYWK